MDDPRPRAFEIYIGGFGGPSYGLWWDGEQLVYESFLSGYEERQQLFLTPSAAQWHRFWQTMDRIGLWSWRNRYGPGERFEPVGLIRDGMHWSLTVARADHSIESSGDSGGPGSADLDDSPQFASFAQAVSRLIGGRPFG
jgi:hypothetical protein